MTTSKITKLDIKDGKNEAFIAFEDKKWGIYKFEGACQYAVGDTVSYESTTETFPSGKKMDFFTIGAGATAPASTPPPPAQQPTSQPQPSATLTPTGLSSLKFEGRLRCIQLAHDAYLAGKLDAKEAKNHCREWVVLADALIDDLAK